MKTYILNKLILLIKNFYPNYTKEELATLKYGLEGIYITLTKTIIIFTIAYFLKIHKQLLFIIIIYNFLRLFSFGMHSKNSTSCLLSSLFIFIGSVYLCQLIQLPFFIKIFVAFISIIIFIKYSPADTAKRPIINKKKRFIYKLVSTLTIILYSYLLLINNQNFISNALFLAMVLQSFLITPLCYSIFNQTYNNYLGWKGGTQC